MCFFEIVKDKVLKFYFNKIYCVNGFIFFLIEIKFFLMGFFYFYVNVIVFMVKLFFFFVI